MFNARTNKIFFAILLFSNISFASGKLPEDQQDSIRKTKFHTSYSLSKVWAPIAGSIIAAVLFASAPAISLSLMPSEPEALSIRQAIKMAGWSGAALGTCTAFHFIEQDKKCVECEKIEKSKETSISHLLKYLGMAALGGWCGASLCAIVHNYYPNKIPTVFTKNDTISQGLVMGAYCGFSNGLHYMQTTICSDCKEKNQLQYKGINYMEKPALQ